MALNNLVKFLVSNSQLETIKNDARRKGFKTISEYARHQIFSDISHRIDTTARLIRIEDAINKVMQNDRSKS